MKNRFLILFFLGLSFSAWSQDTMIRVVDTLPAGDTLILSPDDDPPHEILHPPVMDTPLTVLNLSPFISLHVDSVLSYRLKLNKSKGEYFYYLKNAPVGMRLDRDDGLLSFRPQKSYFITGKLKYDIPYTVRIGVHDVQNPSQRLDTSFTIVFFNTEIIPSRIKTTVSGTVMADEGETLAFNILCENGTSPIDNILTISSKPLGNFTPALKCNDAFSWTPSYDFVKETDTGKVKRVVISFIGSTSLKQRDTMEITVIVRDALNYPLAKEQYNIVVDEINRYILQMKYTFLVLDKSIKKTKRTRTGFDLTSSATALTGTILATSDNPNTQKTGAIMPGIGVTLTPIKEATAPPKTAEQNQATLVRSSIKRMTYILQDNRLEGEKDPYLVNKMTKLKEELKQSQLQLIDVPLEMAPAMSEKDLDQYFNSPKVNKKYRLQKRK